MNSSPYVSKAGVLVAMAKGDFHLYGQRASVMLLDVAFQRTVFETDSDPCTSDERSKTLQAINAIVVFTVSIIDD